MATWAPSNLTVKGVKAEFHQTLDKIPTVWDKHCQIVKSTAASEQHVWPGQAPIPRQFLNQRSIQGLRDFTYTKENQEFELTLLIKRTALEDDQTGLIMSRVRELAEVWGTYKDYLFATMVEAGQSSAAHPWADYDGSTNDYFFDDDHSWGSSGTIDNKLTSKAMAANAVPTAHEHLTEINLAKAKMLAFKDDQGRPFNTLASTNMRILASPMLEAPARQAMNATVLPALASPDIATTDVAIAGTGDNVFRGMADVDICPYLTQGTTTQDWYVSMLGAERKPYVMQERMPLEIIVLSSADEVAKNNGLLILTRERFVMFYGDLRRAAWHQFTT